MPADETSKQRTMDATVVKPWRHLLLRVSFLLASVCWLTIGLGFGAFLIEYLFQHGAGIRILGISISSTSVLIGVIHFIGLSLGMLFSLALGIWFGARGVVGGKK